MWFFKSRFKANFQNGWKTATFPTPARATECIQEGCGAAGLMHGLTATICAFYGGDHAMQGYCKVEMQSRTYKIKQQ